MKAGITSHIMQRETRNLLRKEAAEKKKKSTETVPEAEDEIVETVSHEASLNVSHPRQPRSKYFGEIIEMDGSIHQWFGNEKSCLHLAVDKCTNTIVGAHFDKQETLDGYYHVYKQILENYGIPAKFVTDNRTVFNYKRLNEDKKTSDKDVLTQFGYACKQLGVDLVTTSVSQVKGLVERDNGTIQRRLVNEFKLHNITTIEEANEYLVNTFVPYFNEHFSLKINNRESVYESITDANKINYTLAVLTARKIDNGNAIKYMENYYQPYEDDKIKCFRPKTECLVIKAFNGELMVSIDNKVYELRKLEEHKKYSEEFDFANKPAEPARTEKYIPPMRSSWEIGAFNHQEEKAPNYGQYA